MLPPLQQTPSQQRLGQVPSFGNEQDINNRPCHFYQNSANMSHQQPQRRHGDDRRFQGPPNNMYNEAPRNTPTLPQQSCQVSHPTIGQLSPVPVPLDGRNWGVQIATVHYLHQFWQGRVELLEVTVSKKCVTLTAPGLELRFKERSSLLLAQYIVHRDKTTRNLPRSLALGDVCGFLEIQVKESFFFFWGENYEPPPLAEIRSTHLQVDIIMQGREPTAVLPEFVQYVNG